MVGAGWSSYLKVAEAKKKNGTLFAIKANQSSEEDVTPNAVQFERRIRGLRQGDPLDHVDKLLLILGRQVPVDLGDVIDVQQEAVQRRDALVVDGHRCRHHDEGSVRAADLKNSNCNSTSIKKER